MAVGIARLPPVVSMASCDPAAKPAALPVRRLFRPAAWNWPGPPAPQVQRGPALHGELAGSAEIGQRGRLRRGQDAGSDGRSARIAVAAGQRHRACADWTTAPLPLMAWETIKPVSPRLKTSVALLEMPPEPSVPLLPPSST